jgi:hypothetical protein
MKKILIILLVLLTMLTASHTFFWKKGSENQTQHGLDGSQANKTPNQALKSNKIQFLYFRVYHLVEGKPIESYQYGQKDIFPFMRKFDLVNNKLIVYSNVNGCEALIGTLGSLCCLNETKRWCNFSLGVESLYGISYGVSKFLLAENYSLNLSFAWNGERILLFHANKSYPLKFGEEILQLNDSFAWIYSDNKLQVVNVKPYMETKYLEVELDCAKLEDCLVK